MIEIVYVGGASKPKTVVIKNKKMAKSFNELFSWFEYLVKGDWVSDGKHFCTQIYDRLQMHTATVLIPLDFFIYNGSTEDSMEMQTSSYGDSKNVLLIAEQTSNAWINYHNLMHFLDDENQDSKQNIAFDVIFTKKNIQTDECIIFMNAKFKILDRVFL